MSLHSYSKCWLHLVWGALKREKLITDKEERKRVSSYLFVMRKLGIQQDADLELSIRALYKGIIK